MSRFASRRFLRTVKTWWSLPLLVSLGELLGCSSGDSGGPTNNANTTIGGSQTASATGGASSVVSSVGGVYSTGGMQQLGGASSAVIDTGGTAQTGSTARTGGAAATGGRSANGGRSTTGGKASAGGVSPAAGGSLPGNGGTTSTGGAIAIGGSQNGTGGAVSGGASGAGATSVGGGNAKPSAGCGKTPTLKNSPTATANQNTLSVAGASRQFLVRWPTNYDNTHPYRLVLDFHGATGKDTDVAPSYFGLFDLSNNSTIFAAPSASGGIWALPTDLNFVDQILTAVEADLCIDLSRIEIEGFSQGAALVWNLACQRPGVFRAAVGHSAGGLAAPSSCQPIPYFGSGGLQESVKQTTQTDQFAKFDGCTVSSLPTAPTGGHACTSYTGCPVAAPVRWCNFDGPHTASPNDSGKATSWMPAEVWQFLSQF